ncbi:PGPGW domain-containing protein [Desulfopila aestuarii]|uniref:Putative transmembrane protein (PGPGW) n=1 Tax=Desulfopila aestuarii DSM 18488 TaxID=1121416 RepID=A0A1M7Y1S5_9BACT|nr:PGPGW domain-containing protein [Desulfopila aestuarii]SHO45793.1 Putative transmembrane protein (PGPGW) [Desulfopila aestuarii DSM 18488]
MNISVLKQYSYLLEVLAALSALTFIVSLVCIPLIVARLPRNYFQHRQERIASLTAITPGNLVLLLIRNIVGLLLFLAGVAMLFLPGQGVITMVIGIAVMSFPYKRRLLVILTTPPSVRKGLNWIRHKMKKESFYWQ